MRYINPRLTYLLKREHHLQAYYKSNQIKFITTRRTKLVTNTAITVTQDDTMK